LEAITTFPKHLFYRKNYETRLVMLTSKPLSIQVLGDFLDVISTNADLSRVYIWFNERDMNPRLPLNSVLGATTPFHRIILDWEDSETGKFIIFLIGREFSFRVLKSLVHLAGDLVGLLRLVRDYDIISLDLSVARSNVLVADNVIYLKVLESTTSGALYSIKLFDTTKKDITQAILPPGSDVRWLNRAKVFVSNPAQPAGVKLDLFVFMG
jgi:hypothetical protein